MTARRSGADTNRFVEQLEARRLFAIQAFPIRPTDLTATAISSTCIELTWTDDVPDEISFRIYRTQDDPSQPDTVWTEEIGAPANSTRWRDLNVVPNTQYFYQIRSVTPAGLSDPEPFTLVDPPDHPVEEAEPAVSATTLAADAFAQIVTNTNNPDQNDLVVRGTTAADNIAVTLSGGNVSVTLNGGAPLAFPTADVPRIQIYGSNGNDLITIGAGLSATVKLINISGGNGNDTLVGNDGNDRINGDAGNDSILGNDGDDVLTGGAGNDRIFGGNGNDLIDGGAGNDRLEGGADDDTLIGGTGRNQLFGQSGNDSLVGNRHDLIQDF